jgi:oxygen-dependent protoporphyrinogen oxidase
VAGLSRRGRRRAARDLLIRTRRDRSDESLGALLRRRLGDEATDLAVAPLLAGLFAGDVDRLSTLATFPELPAWELGQGSLIRGSQAARRNARGAEAGPMFLKLKGGHRPLTDRLAERLGPDVVRTGTARDGDRAAGRRRLRGADRRRWNACRPTRSIVATPGWAAADLLEGIAPPAAADLLDIPYASTAVVLLVYPEGTQPSLPAGTGFVVPRGRAPMTACTWLSSKWPREDYGTRAVVRCYVGSAGDDDVVDAPDEDLVAACERHLAALLPAAGTRRAHRRRPLAPLDAAVRGRPPRASGADPLRAAGGYRRDRLRLRRRGHPRLRARGRRGGRTGRRAPGRHEGDGSMTDAIYALYPVFLASDEFRG